MLRLPDDPASLLRQAADGDEAAFQTIFEAALQDLTTRVRFWLLPIDDPHGVESIVEDGVLQLIEETRSGRVDPELNWQAYLSRKCFYFAKRELRRSGHDSELQERLRHHIQPSAVTTDSQSIWISVDLDRVLRALPPQQQEIIYRRFFLDEDIRKIAKDLGLKRPNTVSVIIFRACAKMKRVLEEGDSN